MSSINTTLSARQSTYGDFSEVAAITQSLMQIVESGANYEQMSDVQKTSLFMIANKMARIVNGNPTYDDSWHDISGYATLVVNDLKNAPETPQAILMAESVKHSSTAEKCDIGQMVSCEYECKCHKQKQLVFFNPKTGKCHSCGGVVSGWGESK